MLKKAKKFILVSIASLMIMAPGLVPGALGVAAAATSSGITSGLCTGANAAAGSNNNNNCTTAGNGSDTVQTIAGKVVNYFSLIVGAIAIIMIIYGGFKYITSGGDTGNVSSAKNTLIYAVVGLIIVALAQFIVHFVLNATSNAVPSQ